MDAPQGRLAALRHFTGLSANAFSEAVGCTRQMVGMIERGERSPGRDIAIGIERVSRSPRDDGAVWPDGPLVVEEWGRKAGAEPFASAQKTPLVGEFDPATSTQSPEAIDDEGEAA
jgi:transcriptional regulator with XRE-family HTH domain